MDTRIFLQTSRLRLREFTPDDVDQLVALDSDPEVMRYISYGAPTSRATFLEKILPSWIKYYEGEGRVGFWAAESIGGEFLGWFHLRPDRFASGELDLGYRLQRRFWNQGFATEGSLALIADGFAVSKFEKICARALIGNLASQRVMLKCGLTLEEHFVYPEHIVRGGTEAMRRAVKYSITRNRWLAKQEIQTG